MAASRVDSLRIFLAPAFTTILSQPHRPHQHASQRYASALLAITLNAGFAISHLHANVSRIAQPDANIPDALLLVASDYSVD
jgi:hypothetical protein